MLDDFTFGQFFPMNSVIHAIDARVKLVLTVYFLVLIFCAKNFASLCLLAVFILMILLLSKIPLRMYLKNLKFILPIILITAVINLFYISGGNLIFEFWIIKITDIGLKRSIFMALRVVLLILVSAVLTYTTSANDITDGLDRLFSPLKFVGLGTAVHTMTMMMTIALRFIPTLVEETQKIMNAQKARGADFESGGLMQKVKAVIPILIPLLISSVRRAYDLAEAMESRCYNGGEGKTHLKVFSLRTLDFVTILFSILILAGVILLNIFAAV